VRTILKTSHLNKTFRLGSLLKGIKINALDDVNLEIKSDQPMIISLVGESGSGKTTLAKVILRIYDATSGEVRVDDKLIAGFGRTLDKRALRSTIQPIFQNPFEAFNSYRPLDAYLQGTAQKIRKAATKAELEDVLEEALGSVGLHYKDVRGKYTTQFSGGELQRISIARALIPRPQIIVADEPVSMIDASLRMNIVNLFLSLKEQYQTSFLYITHDLATAYYISDVIAIMYRGCIVEFGKARAILTNPQHPYTQLLLESIPLIGKKWEQGTMAMSDMETKEFRFEGCKFYNRCPRAKDQCMQERPSAVRKDDGRDVYCHFA
jgi:peptide/nickel transport system ATP-binding protein